MPTVDELTTARDAALDNAEVSLDGAIAKLTEAISAQNVEMLKIAESRNAAIEQFNADPTPENRKQVLLLEESAKASLQSLEKSVTEMGEQNEAFDLAVDEALSQFEAEIDFAASAEAGEPEPDPDTEINTLFQMVEDGLKSAREFKREEDLAQSLVNAVAFSKTCDCDRNFIEWVQFFGVMTSTYASRRDATRKLIAATDLRKLPTEPAIAEWVADFCENLAKRDGRSSGMIRAAIAFANKEEATEDDSD